MPDSTIKGLAASAETLNGSPYRFLIVHSRWNLRVIESLVKGATDRLLELGVRPDNIVTRNVSGSFELPLACSRLIAASQVQASATAADLISGGSLLDSPTASAKPHTKKTGPFDAVIAIGVLIKGSTMHFEYIADATSHGLMRVGLDTGVPVVFGVLTCLTDEQALQRAGLVQGGHNHGHDWAETAVEQALLVKSLAQGL